MLVLKSDRLQNIFNFNSELFLSGNSEMKIRNIEAKIRKARAKVLILMRELEAAKSGPAIRPIDENALAAFFARHPAMRIEYEDGIISLLSENQCVAFHTRRGSNSVGRNDDIIYVTLPLYGFRLDFHPDGCVSGSALKSEVLQSVGGKYISVFGHPHATKPRADSSRFKSICNGNNRFIQDWQSIMSAKSLSGPTLLRLLSQAAVWMETVNLSDMYGTYLVENMPCPEVDISVSGALKVYKRLLVEVESVPQFLADIHRSFGSTLYKRCAYSIWLYKAFHYLHRESGSKNALYYALCADILVMKYENFKDLTSIPYAKDMERTNETAFRCFDELCGYCPRGDQKSMAELYPDIFTRR